MNTRLNDSVPMISSWLDDSPFSDLGDVSCVDDLTKMLSGWQRNSSPEFALGAEAKIGEWNTVPASLLNILSKHGRAVAKITVKNGRDYRGTNRPNGWSGTGFLVAPDLLLTNHHVVHDIETAERAVIEFGYELSTEELLADAEATHPTVTQFKLQPSKLFITSPFSGNGLDFTFIAISPEAAESFGFIEMSRGSFVDGYHQPTFLVHHPDGRLKEASIDDTELLAVNSSALLYAADTEGGSSGAPVFARSGNLIALHHAWHNLQADPGKFSQSYQTLQDGQKIRIANEGIKISAIAIRLEEIMSRGGAKSASAAKVLENMKGSDTLTGFYGGLGRFDSASGGEESVVDVYRGTASDIDVAFWNIEWLSRTWENEGKLERVATVIADLNADIWGFSEVSPDAVKALVDVIQSKFGEVYDAAFSEPDSSSTKQTTAVIWKRSTVVGKREEWPEEIENLWHRKSQDDLGLEAVHGKIFNRYPGLFSFSPVSDEYDHRFYLVPLHLKAMSEGSMRRRLASKLLAHAVDKMIGEYGYEKDWILGGDFNAPLASGDFLNLTKLGFVPLAAEDEAAGAFSYLKSPNTMIDNIFISQDMRVKVDSDDFFIVAADRTVDKFAKQVSDHLPVVMRLALTKESNRQSLTNSRDVFDDSSKENRRASENASGEHWVSDGLAKAQFMLQNAASFRDLVARMNRILETQYSRAIVRLTVLDMWLLTYVEAGFKNGSMDPNFVHSLGEKGLFPLPSNIRYWNGNDAPAWDQFMSLETNLFHYALYLGQVKNKIVRTIDIGELYTGLFRRTEIIGNEERQAKLLAGIVHGYFVSRNYNNGRVPYEHILIGYGQDRPVEDIMRDTRYVYAGHSILENRERNLRTALRDFRN